MTKTKEETKQEFDATGLAWPKPLPLSKLTKRYVAELDDKSNYKVAAKTKLTKESLTARRQLAMTIDALTTAERHGSIKEEQRRALALCHDENLGGLGKNIVKSYLLCKDNDFMYEDTHRYTKSYERYRNSFLKIIRKNCFAETDRGFEKLSKELIDGLLKKLGKEINFHDFLALDKTVKNQIGNIIKETAVALKKLKDERDAERNIAKLFTLRAYQKKKNNIKEEAVTRLESAMSVHFPLPDKKMGLELNKISEAAHFPQVLTVLAGDYMSDSGLIGYLNMFDTSQIDIKPYFADIILVEDASRTKFSIIFSTIEIDGKIVADFFIANRKTLETLQLYGVRCDIKPFEQNISLLSFEIIFPKETNPPLPQYLQDIFLALETDVYKKMVEKMQKKPNKKENEKQEEKKDDDVSEEIWPGVIMDKTAKEVAKRELSIATTDTSPGTSNRTTPTSDEELEIPSPETDGDSPPAIVEPDSASQLQAASEKTK